MRVTTRALESLEFGAIRDMCERRCATPLGVALAAAIEPLEDTSEADAALDETSEARELLTESGAPALGLSADPSGIVGGLAIEGLRLTAWEILVLVRLCSVTVEARRALGSGAGRWPNLEARASALPDLRALVELIEPHLLPLEGSTVEIADTASPELRRLRKREATLVARAREALEAMLRRSGSEQFLSDRFVTERGGRYVIPVRADSPHAPRGIVHGASSSGATLFLEPLETVDLNNELVRIREEAAAEIERILTDWSERLAGRREDLEIAAGGIGRLDLALARARLARDLRAVRPRLGATGGFKVTEARHPVLEETLARRGDQVVPLTLALEPGEETLVISGPNTGGKTVALKTVGLLAAMAHSGLHVPADEFELPPLRQIQVDIGDHQSIEASLSTFSAHIANIAGILDGLDPPALVLLDEVGTGTDPAEGSALAAALLEHLMRRGATTIVTTHHGSLKAWAYSTPRVANAAVDFDEVALEPTFRLRMGVAGASSGLSIAARLGLDDEVVRAARERVSPDAREAETLLVRLKDLLDAAEHDREEAGRLLLRLERERRELADSLVEAERKRKTEIEKISTSTLQEFRKKSSEMLAAIAEKKDRIRLEKERSRRESDLKETVATEMKKLGVGSGAAGGKSATFHTGGVPPQGLAPGMRVLVATFGREGTVEETDGQMASVQIGGARVRVRVSDCRAPAGVGGDTMIAPTGVGLTRRAVETSELAEPPGEIMLLGYTVDDAVATLDKFLDETFLAGRIEVRIIHGHGTGRLRTAVREFLSRHPQVESHRPGAATEGGSGATIARLRTS